MAYRIYNWDKYFESGYSRKIKGILNWVPVTTSHDGKRFQRLAGHPDGLKIFGAWGLIYQVAAKCPKRGLLVDDRGHALTPQDIADMTGFNATSDIALAFDVLCQPNIAWMERIGTGAEQAPAPTVDPGDDLPSESDRLAAIESIERMLGRKLSAHEFQRFDQWSDTVPESITLGGVGYDRYRLIVESAASAIEHMTNSPRALGGATSYLTRIIDRCVNDGCKPGEFVEAKPKARKSAANELTEGTIDPRDLQV